MNTQASRVYQGTGAAIGWFAIGAQLYLIIMNSAMGVPETILQFFSYFTILTNILAALCLTRLVFNGPNAPRNFFSNPKVLTAITVYITVVGIVYHLLLRHVWDPQGLQWLADQLLHTVMPLIFIVYWFIFVPKAGLQWQDTLLTLVYPFLYCVYVFIRGALTGHYPYPFMDVTVHGYPKVMVNAFMLSFGFLILSLLFIGISKIMKTAYQ